MTIKPLISDSLVSDVEYRIISWLDNRALGSFSCTTPYAYEVLANDGVFKERFLELYKRMHPTPEILFPSLETGYPDCCWKIACCFYPDAQPITVFTQTFLQTALSPPLLLSKEVQNQRKQTEEWISPSARFAAEYSKHGELLVDQYFIKDPFSFINKLAVLKLLCGNFERSTCSNGKGEKFRKARIQIQIERRLASAVKVPISEMLSYLCTGQAPEENWFKMHRHEYVPQLHMIIQGLISQAERFKAGYFVDLETRISDFVSQNARSFHKDFWVLENTLDFLIETKRALAEAENDAAHEIILNDINALMKVTLENFEEPHIVEYVNFLNIYIFDIDSQLPISERVKQVLERSVEVFQQLILSTNAQQGDPSEVEEGAS